MRILSTLGLAAVIAFFATNASAQTTSQYFAGPLDAAQAKSARVAKKLSAAENPIRPGRDLNTVISYPRLNSDAASSTVERPVFTTSPAPMVAPQTQSIGRHVAAQFIAPNQFTETRPSRMYANPQQAIIDANQFIYGDTSRDGLAFGFDNSRLYHPLEGPQLRLQGAPTILPNFGVCDSCDEWAGFCRMKDLRYSCGCGGLKANPGHLGLPWLGSRENCDKRSPICKGKCRSCEDSCGSDGCKSCSECK